jgi:hypothetical protein
VNEGELMRRVAEMFRSMGYYVSTEVPYFERRIDLVALDHRRRRVSCVEGKVTAWQKGIAQILLAQPGSHRSYLAIEERFAGRVPVGVLRRYRIGLITVEGRARIATKAPDVLCTNPYCVRMVREAALNGKAG